MRKCTGVDDFPVAVTVKGLPEQNVGTNRAGEKPSLTRGKLGCCFDSKPLEENKKWSREVGDHPRMVAALPESPGEDFPQKREFTFSGKNLQHRAFSRPNRPYHCQQIPLTNLRKFFGKMRTWQPQGLSWSGLPPPPHSSTCGW